MAVAVHVDIRPTRRRVVRELGHHGILEDGTVAKIVDGGEMQRIVVIGAGGAGKTVLANRLGRILGLPVTHLDALRYTDTWQPVPETEFVAAQQAVATTGRWIIDGNSLASMPVRFAAADTIVFLDLPARVSLWGVLRRRMRYRGGRHPDGVHDRITWPFLIYVWQYRRRTRARVRQCIAEHGRHTTLIEVTSRRAAEQFLDRVAERYQCPCTEER